MNAARAAKIIAAAVWWVLGGPGLDESAEVTYGESGRTEPVTLSVNDAIAQAERKVGYDVRVPEDVPNGFILRSVNAEVGPVGPDLDLSYIRSVTLVYKDDDERNLIIGQQAPQGTLGAPLGARPVDAGQPNVKADIIERPGVTHLTWDSSAATYSIILASRDGPVAPDGEQTVLAVARSMR